MKLFKKFTGVRGVGRLLLMGVLMSGTATAVGGEPSVPKAAHPAANIWVGGQLNQAELQQAANSGITTVINLRPAGEADWDEKSFVEQLGMRYVNLPIAGASDVTMANAQKLKQLLDAEQSGKVYLHCASGNRVGALAALMVSSEGASRQRSIELGKEWGLGSLEERVIQVIDATPKK